MKIPTGSKEIDGLLEGGYETDIITTIYGPAGAGKTCLCMLASCEVARAGKKIIYVDTENGFSVERLKQVASDYKSVLERMIFLKPTRFEQQIKDIQALNELVNDKIGLIVIDTIGSLYRVEMGKKIDIQGINASLGKQVMLLSEIARKKGIPVLIANQVYADFEKKDAVRIVGGDILKYGSKCMIEIQVSSQANRRLVLKKHRSIQEEKSFYFKIVETGIIGTIENERVY